MSTAYTPPNWSQINTTSILVPQTAIASSSASAGGTPIQDQSGTPSNAQTTYTLYVFDAVPRLEHAQEVRKTSHPIQTGANISDHAYIEPAKVVLEVTMSDAVASYSSGMWSGAASKSASAYGVLLAVQQGRKTVTVTTRLRTYQNMLITSLLAPDTNATRYGLKAIVTFEEILMASVTGVSSGLVSTSARPQTTDTNTTGAVQNVTPSGALVGQNNVVGNSTAESYPYVPGAGNWSSDNVAALGVG